ncbi:MAG: DUF2911 domain-containing protein, partial [Chitinophagia bacterium]|nr:DUF2911 domain-containing protein [Chitinophagia bacterium]
KHTSFKNALVSVSYGQPDKAAGKVVPAYGTPWGTGVGEIAEVTLPNGCLFAGKQVNAGTYSLVTVPFKGEWLIFLVNPADVKGVANIDLESIRQKNVVSSNAIIKHNNTDAGNFNLQLKEEGIEITWETNVINIPVKNW